MTAHTLATHFAEIAVRDSGGDGAAILLLHGNSSCKEIFRRQFDSLVSKHFRLIAMDLPGHGGSGNAKDPRAAYTIAGYASAAVEVLKQLGVGRAVVFGWSLGGHVALDMLSRFPGMRGVTISGTPPVPGSIEGVALGFKPSQHMALSSSSIWSDADADAWAHETAGINAPFEPFMLAAARRTDAIAREIFFANALSGQADDQRRIVETSKVPLAVVNGSDDPFINGAYFDTLHYANLWDGKVHVLKGVGHAPFWETPQQFNPLLERFVLDVG
jgi:pimeloyl-ACP methyl ester carboxylesterase